MIDVVEQTDEIDVVEQTDKIDVVEQTEKLDKQLLRQEAIAKLDNLIEQDEEMKDSMRFKRVDCLGNETVTTTNLQTLESDTSNPVISRQSSMSALSRNSKKNKNKRKKNKK